MIKPTYYNLTMYVVIGCKFQHIAKRLHAAINCSLIPWRPKYAENTLIGI